MDVSAAEAEARPWFILHALHTHMSFGENVMTLTTFISSLVIWNVIGLLGAWLFADLHNKINR